MAKLSKKKVQEAIIEYRGNISAVARAFGKSRKWVYQFAKEKYPELWELVEDAREMMLDDAESELYKQIFKGNTTALIFYLKTQGKQRGYVERQEITGQEGGPVSIEYVNDWRSQPKGD